MVLPIPSAGHRKPRNAQINAEPNPNVKIGGANAMKLARRTSSAHLAMQWLVGSQAATLVSPASRSYTARTATVMPLPAANSWRGFQELITRQEYDFTFRWSDVACPKALSTVDKVYALISNSEATKRQSCFLPARKGECAKASIVHEHVVNRNGRRAESGVRRT